MIATLPELTPTSSQTRSDLKSAKKEGASDEKIAQTGRICSKEIQLISVICINWIITNTKLKII